MINAKEMNILSQLIGRVIADTGYSIVPDGRITIKNTDRVSMKFCENLRENGLVTISPHPFIRDHSVVTAGWKTYKKHQ